MSNHTETTTVSWGQRLKEAFAKILIGLALFVLAFPLLFWGEGRSVARYKTLKEGEGSVVSIPVDHVDATKEGKLVHLSGKAVTDDLLQDTDFSVKVNAIKLKRNVEMYQWVEHQETSTRKKVGGQEETTTEYSYQKEWLSTVVSSSSFQIPQGHENPDAMPYENQEYVAQNVSLGAFRLSDSLISQIGPYESYTLPTEETPVEEKAATDEGAATETPADTNVHRMTSGFYLGNTPTIPAIGDIRVSFEIVSPREISIVSGQRNDTFSPYITSNKGSIEMLQNGNVSAAEMFTKAQTDNKILTWLLRLAGFLMMFFGLSMIFKPLSVLGDVIPFLGNLIGMGTNLVAFLIALICSLATVACAWLFYRPMFSIPLLGVAAILVLYLFTRKKKAKA
ncbi:MAG: TMEM43 family protein [Planctomycetia bacterium]|nr:TMEM43 family protein [Planctomycetia bacterium]